jgi:hypothetical protein
MRRTPAVSVAKQQSEARSISNFLPHLMKSPFVLSTPLRRAIGTPPPACRARCFSSSAFVWSGHSKWATIKHDKGKNDKAKSSQRQLCAKDITNAVKRMRDTSIV